MREELDKSDAELEVGEKVETGEPAAEADQVERDDEHDEDCDETEVEPGWLGQSLSPQEEALGEGERGRQQGVQAEHHVIQLDGENSVRVAPQVFRLNCRVQIHFNVEDAVESESDHIQDNKVQAEPLDAGRPKVENDLRVERERPEEEVKPTNSIDQALDDV